MGRKGKNTHMKTLSAPKSYDIKRSRHGRQFISKPMPGPHKTTQSISLCVALRDMLKVTNTIRETTSIIKKGYIQVDGKTILEPKYPIGLMDVISINKEKKEYRMLMSRKKHLVLDSINNKESRLKPCKIINKFLTKKGIMKVTMHDGREITLPPELGTISSGDSILVEIPSYKIIEAAKLVAGSFAFCFKGRSTGLYGSIEKVNEGSFKRPATVQIRTMPEEIITTIKDYVFVVGNTSSWVSLGGLTK